MPSPLGHALGGVAAAWLAGGRLPRTTHATVVVPLTGGRVRRVLGPVALEAALFAAVAVVPDLDLLAGVHRTVTHSIGAVILAGMVALLVTRGRWPAVVVGVMAAWGSHLLLDWLGADMSPPSGLMLLWPFTSHYYQSSLDFFDAISRRYWLPDEFIWHNARAVAKEAVVLAPVAWLAYRWARRRDSAQG